MYGFNPRPMQRMNPYMAHYYQQPQWPMNPSPPPQHGATGFLKQLLGQSNMGAINLEGLLDKVQRALNMAEQITPMIQQYGPLIRNAPALLKLLAETTEEESNEEETSDEMPKPPDESSSEKSNNQKQKRVQREVPKESVPKLYI